MSSLLLHFLCQRGFKAKRRIFFNHTRILAYSDVTSRRLLRAEMQQDKTARFGLHTFPWIPSFVLIFATSSHAVNFVLSKDHVHQLFLFSTALDQVPESPSTIKFFTLLIRDTCLLLSSIPFLLIISRHAALK